MSRKRKTIYRYKSKPKTYRKKRYSNKIKLIQPEAIAYGAVRGWASGMLQNITKNIPILSNVGVWGDEVAMGIADYYIAKNTSGFIKKVATDGLIIENALFGEDISGQFLNKKTAQGQAVQVYG